MQPTAATPTTSGPARRRRPRPPRLGPIAAFGARATTVDDELLRELQVLVDLGVVETQPSPEGTRYALADPTAAAAGCDPDGASRT
jgi:hypothetical protein